MPRAHVAKCAKEEDEETDMLLWGSLLALGCYVGGSLQASGSLS